MLLEKGGVQQHSCSLLPKPRVYRVWATTSTRDTLGLSIPMLLVSVSDGAPTCRVRLVIAPPHYSTLFESPIPSPNMESCRNVIYWYLLTALYIHCYHPVSGLTSSATRFSVTYLASFLLPWHCWSVDVK